MAFCRVRDSQLLLREALQARRSTPASSSAQHAKGIMPILAEGEAECRGLPLHVLDV